MTEAAVLSSTTPREAVLVLHRSGDDDCIVRLTDGKVTIGSGQSCTVRLTDPGVRPLHCLITPGADGPMVRRWSDGTLLNGEPFSEAPLTLGDQLSIGPVEFFLEQPSTGELDSTAVVPTVPRTALNSVDCPPQSTLSAQEPSLESTAEDSSEATDEAPDEAGPLQEPVRTSRGRARALARLARRQRTENQQLAVEFAALQARLTEVEAEREQLVGERDDLRTQLGALAKDLLQLREELTARSTAEDDRVAELERRQADLEQQIVERDVLVGDLREELERRQQTPDSQESPAASAAAEADTDGDLALEVSDPSQEGVQEETAETSPAGDFDEDLDQVTLPETGSQESPATPEGSGAGEELAEWGIATDTPEPAVLLQQLEQLSSEAMEPEVATTDEPAADDLPIDSSEPADDLWNTVQSSSARDNIDDWCSPTPTPEPLPNTDDLWDVERQLPEALATTEELPEAGTAEPHAVEPTLSETSADGAVAAADDPFAGLAAVATSPKPQESLLSSIEEEEKSEPDEGDVWGRLSSLRAAASEKLHYEVKHSVDDAADLASSGETSPEEQEGPEQESSLPDHTLEPVADDSDAADAESTSDDQWVEATLDELEEPALEEADATELEPVLPTTAFDPPAESIKEPEEPVSYVERFRHLLDEGGSETELPACEPLATEPVIEPAHAESPPVAEEGEESIEDYMAKMMARLRGESSPSPVAAAVPAETLVGTPAKATTGELSATPSKSADTTATGPFPESTESILARPKSPTESLGGEETTPAPPKEMLENLEDIKTTAIPEQSADMSTLRDLANSSAREAIKIANARRYREMALSNLLMCVTGALGGGYLLWEAGGELGMQLFCGAGAIAASAFWALRTARSVSAPSEPKVVPMVRDDSSASLPIAGVEKR